MNENCIAENSASLLKVVVAALHSCNIHLTIGKKYIVPVFMLFTEFTFSRQKYVVVGSQPEIWYKWTCFLKWRAKVQNVLKGKQLNK